MLKQMKKNIKSQMKRYSLSFTEFIIAKMIEILMACGLFVLYMPLIIAVLERL